MENEITNTNLESENQLVITDADKLYLKTAGKWGNFLAIMGFIGTGLMFLAGVSFTVFSPLIGSNSAIGSTLGMPFGIFGIVYVLIAVLYFFPAYYLYNFSTKIIAALNSNSQSNLDSSIKSLGLMFKFIGIMTIILISLYLIMIPVMIFAIMSKSMAL